MNNYLALIEIVHHLRAGPRAIWPNPDKDAEWLESFVKLSQTTINVDGALEAVSIYVVPAIISPAKSMPVIRHLAWDRQADRERCKTGNVAWPAIKIEYFSLDAEDLAPLDLATRDLQNSMSEFPTQVSGLNLDRMYPDPSVEPKVIFAPPRDTTPPFVRWVQLGMSTSAIQIDFWERDAPAIDAAWLSLWQILQSKCQEKRRIAGVKEKYTISPAAYAQALLTGDD